MKEFKAALVGVAFAVASGVSPVAFAQYTNTLTFQGVTFNTYAVDSNTLELQILHALSGGVGNWANIEFIKAIDIREVNSGQIVTATMDSSSDGGDWTLSVTGGINGNIGCASGNTPGACFSTTPSLALDDDMVWRFTFWGDNLNFDSPHLKVQFLDDSVQANATGDLLSQNIPAIPEPEIYAMLLAGLGLMGFVARRRRQQLAAA